MKKSIFLWLIILFTSFAIKAQENEYQAPDYDAIQKMMNEDPNLYPSIEAKFLRADYSSLSEDEATIFYYGKVFRDDYSPYKSLEWTNNIKKILFSEHPKKSLLKKELKNINKAIADYPVLLECYFIKYVICNELYGEESKEAKSSLVQISSLLKAILSTGDGKSMESAFHVVQVHDEHAIMRMSGIGWKQQSLHEDEGQYYDRFELDDEEVTELYFNITPCFKALFAEFAQSDASDSYSNRIEIPLGTKVTLRLKEVEKGKYQAAIIDKQSFSGEVDETTFSVENDSDIVELVFAQIKLDSGKEKVKLCAKSFNNNILSFDSFIQYVGKNDFESTSNVGWYPKALMIEQWYPGIAKIRLENIRITER
ncbi:MAG: DUF4919 domain-containing protein [Bacteroidales bacterium]|nr:DUF4919 domain-containing protein [Bacteroidales bacterium]